jgi:glycosyltransferase involved in cell wall biosynthesis
MSDKPFFSIIIPALNEEKHLPLLLQALQSQTEKDFEVIVVDGGSTDKTEEKAHAFEGKFSKFTYHKEKLKSVGMSRNAGAKLAAADWLIFFDADVVINPDFLEKINKVISDWKPDVMTAWNSTKDKGIAGKMMLFLISFGIFLVHKIRAFANGPCIIIKKSLFGQIHGFNEKIIVGEDLDLTDRATKAGGKYEFLINPKAYVSTRRYEKEGFFVSLYKALRGGLHTLLIGPVYKSLYEYKMGGQYFKEDNKI